MDSVILNIICTLWCAIICSWSIIISTFCKINDLSHTISSYVLLYFFTSMNIAAYNNIQLSIHYYLINNFCKINDLSHIIPSYVLLYFFTLMNIASYNNIQLSIYYYI